MVHTGKAKFYNRFLLHADDMELHPELPVKGILAIAPSYRPFISQTDNHAVMQAIEPFDKRLGFPVVFDFAVSFHH
jgi:hypothetical protein